MKVALAVLALLALAGCENTTKVMKSWIGDTDAHLMAVWGAPDAESRAGGGYRILTYNGRNGYGTVICRQNFTVNADHRVEAVSHNC